MNKQARAANLGAARFSTLHRLDADSSLLCSTPCLVCCSRAGGTQRLTKAIGKSKAMEMCLTGNMITAAELERAGLVSRVLPQEQLMPAALQLAEQIASLSLPVVKLAKSAVLQSFESTLNSGMQIERSLFHSTFALADQKEGMSAFVEKRKPDWKHQ